MTEPTENAVDLSQDPVFQHIFTTILNQPPDRLTDFQDWFTHHKFLDFSEFLELYVFEPETLADDLEFKTKRQPKTQKLHPTFAKQIRAFLLWANHLHSLAQRFFGADDWLALTREDYGRFRIGTYFPTSSQSRALNVPSTPGTPSLGTPGGKSTMSNSSQSQQDLTTFRKGIKRDSTAYEVLKEEKNYDPFMRSFRATALAQGLGNVLDPSFVVDSTDPAASALYREQQIFLYSVLVRCLQTDKGRAIIRAHTTDMDATAVLDELRTHHTDSELSRKEIMRLTAYLTNIRLDSAWRGTTSQFLLHFNEQLRLLDSLCDSSQKLPDFSRTTFLMQAVDGNEDLRRVKIFDDFLKSQSGTHAKMSYDDYYRVLTNAAFQFDQHLASKNGSKRRAYASQQCDHDIFDSDHSSSHDDFIQEDLVSIFQANRTRNRIDTRTQRIFLPKDIWDATSDEVKEMLKAHNKRILANSPNSKPRQTNLHEVSESSADENPTATDNTEEACQEAAVATESDPSPDQLLTMLHEQTDYPESDIQRVLSANKAKSKGVSFSINATYRFSKANLNPTFQLIDRGANGGLAGSDLKIIHKTGRKINIIGIDNHEVTGLDIVTAAGLYSTQLGTIVGIFHEYAYLGKGRSIHSPPQMEYFKTLVDDKSVLVGGRQRIETLDGYALPLIFKGGLVYLDSLGIPTDNDLATYPHVVFTSPDEWNPDVMDHSHSSNPDTHSDWMDLVNPDPIDRDFSATGDYVHRVNLVSQILTLHQQTNLAGAVDFQHSRYHQQSLKSEDFEALRPYFAWASADSIANTFKVSTRYVGFSPHDYLKKHFRTRNPVLNIGRRREGVATDTVFADTPAIDNGSKAAQIFVGRDTLVCDVYGVKSDAQFVNTLEDNIRLRGAMDVLISDRAQALVSKKVQDILRSLFISQYTSEPHHQHQNFAENRYSTLKRWTNLILNTSGCPPSCWLLALDYASTVLNHLASPALNGRTPIERLTGSTPDVSFLLAHYFWEPIYFSYDPDRSSYPSTGNESKGRWVGFGTGVGDPLTWKILTDETSTILFRSTIRSATSSLPNRRLDPEKGEIVHVRGRHEDSSSGSTPSMPTIDPHDLLGRKFLGPKLETGERFRGLVVAMVQDQAYRDRKRFEDLSFEVEYDEGRLREIVTYNELLNHLDHDPDDVVFSEQEYRMRQITAHQGPLKPTDAHYKGSSYNVLVEWENGETSYEPLSFIASDDPLLCAIYAKNNGLLDLDGWKHLAKYVKTEKRLIKTLRRHLQQAKKKMIRRNSRAQIKYRFGVQVPRDYDEAILLDVQNKNNLWSKATELELDQVIHQYKTFLVRDKAIFQNGKLMNAPEGYQRLRVHLVFDVKHDGRRKARLVADGHLTIRDPSMSSYSGVVSIRGLRLVIFLSELNKLEIWAADIGNAYLEAQTKEKLFIIAGPEFGDLEGKILIFDKALYGLVTSGARWHDKLYDVLQEMGFKPCKIEPDIWFKLNEEHGVYEYIAVYVDDLAIAAKNPKEICDTFTEKFKFKLKGVGPIAYHLGCTYKREPDGTLVGDPRRYVEKILEGYEILFGNKPKKYKTPLDRQDHPELDDSELCEEKDIAIYQSIIGQLQWVVTIGRFDIFTSVMTLARFRAAPRIGHLERAKRVVGYLAGMYHGAIRFRLHEPDYSNLPDQNYDWFRVYDGAREEVPKDAPEPKGLPVVTTTFVDANLKHDMITGRSASGILHLVNGTPMDWYSKRQATVETATFGSEFVSARIACDQIMELRIFLRYLGVPLRDSSYLFGDNKSVVTNSTVPHSILSKRHHFLSYNRVRECMASKAIKFYWKDGKTNPADVLTKNWDFVTGWPLLKPLLFWRGDVSALNDKINEPKQDRQTKGESHKVDDRD